MRVDWVDMEPNSNSYCVVDSPTSVLPASWPSSKDANRKSNGNPKYANDIPSLQKQFTKISFSRYIVRPI